MMMLDPAHWRLIIESWGGRLMDMTFVSLFIYFYIVHVFVVEFMLSTEDVGAQYN
jgi:hypothetical protein